MDNFQIRRISLSLLITTTLFANYGCRSAYQAPVTNQLEMDLHALMQSQAKAVRELNADKVLSNLANSPDFQIFVNGQILGYPEISEGEPLSFRFYDDYFCQHDFSWDSLHIQILDQQYGTAASTFTQVVTDCRGNKNNLTGEVFWLARRGKDGFKLLTGHAKHNFPEKFLLMTMYGDALTEAEHVPFILNPGESPHTWWGKICLREGALRFMAGDNWGFQWGGAGAFPHGIATRGEGAILVTAGCYDVRFNDRTGAYSFAPADLPALP